jgi:hypothetical protein
MEHFKTRNTLTAILLYELSRIEQLPIQTQMLIASDLTAKIQNLRMSKAQSEQDFHRDQAAYFSLVKRNTLEQKNQLESQVSFAVASIMHCIHKGFEVEGLLNELITSVIDWKRACIAKTQT